MPDSEPTHDNPRNTRNLPAVVAQGEVLRPAAENWLTRAILTLFGWKPGSVRDDLQVVLDNLVETAARLCDAGMSGIAIRSGDLYRYVATLTFDPEWDQMLRTMSFAPGRGSLPGRVALERQPVHIVDLAADTVGHRHQTVRTEHGVLVVLTAAGLADHRGAHHHCCAPRTRLEALGHADEVRWSRRRRSSSG